MDEWEQLRENAWERIFRDKEIGYLDPDIFPLLEAFRNARKHILKVVVVEG